MAETKYFDVFNGDADGICALHQLRMQTPCPIARLVTGVKRDIRLLEKISSASGAVITVLDVSMATNKKELITLLANGCTVFYADHHVAGEIPAHPALTAHIDPAAETCTSLIIDRLLGGRYRPWAVAAAFGDNLHEAAARAAEPLNLSDAELAALREVGELLNYNGYGPETEDLYFLPTTLYQAVHAYEDPLDFHARSPELQTLRLGFSDDIRRARAIPARLENEVGRVYELPAERWAKRVVGVFSNEKAREREELAHSLLIANRDGTYRVSVRAPLTKKSGADLLCCAFPTGGGRAAAAGINNLPAAMLDSFLRQFTEVFSNL